ncbi:sulfotransferase [Halobacillus sp. BBL2006]|uniref:sulfotransferase family protein n=1 Tax=Halobacillus sp. BBL2006 TaxID=1543706 RepID=UPI0005435584|nr:sulfotransferase [Halobacillus sp. BBL2006]KHE71456.1 hypothetical protein LD39_09710 [Halobacillus sp. BBL2006]
MSKIIPNLFIVGAAKSGTTALYNYLNAHPEVFMSSTKEPHFFCQKYIDLPLKGPGDLENQKKWITNQVKYKKIFNQYNSEKVAGEASTQYLYYYNTAKELHSFNPNAKIIIMLRDPIDRAVSAYTHLKRDLREKYSFDEGLRKEEYRIDNNYEFIWHYKNVGLYSKQVKKYIEVFGEDNVKVIIYENFKKDLDANLYEIYKFLGINEKVRIKNRGAKYNVSGVPKNKFINYLANEKNFLKKILKPIIPSNIRGKISGELRSFSYKKLEISEETRSYLIDFYQKDIESLEEILGYKITTWSKHQAKDEA